MYGFVRYRSKVASVAENHFVPCSIIGRRPSPPTEQFVRPQKRFGGPRLVVRGWDVRNFVPPLKRSGLFGEPGDAGSYHMKTPTRDSRQSLWNGNMLCSDRLAASLSAERSHEN